MYFVGGGQANANLPLYVPLCESMLSPICPLLKNQFGNQFLDFLIGQLIYGALHCLIVW